MVQTTNRIVQLFQPPARNHSQQSNLNISVSRSMSFPFFPLGLSDLMLLNAEAHKSLGNMEESSWSIRLAAQIAERKYEEYSNDRNIPNSIKHHTTKYQVLTVL